MMDDNNQSGQTQSVDPHETSSRRERRRGSSTRRSGSGPDLTWVFALVAGGLVIGLILQWPGLDYSVNDASRWNTIYMLVSAGRMSTSSITGRQFREGEKFRRDVDVSGLSPEEVQRSCGHRSCSRSPTAE